MCASEIHKLGVVDVDPRENNPLRGVVGDKELLQVFHFDFFKIFWRAKARKT